MKKGKKMILLCLAVLFLLYICESVYIGAKVFAMVKGSYATYGGDNTYADMVSDEIYRKMCYRNGYLISSQGNPSVKEINRLLFPLACHWITGGKATYWYTYEIYDDSNELVGGSWNIPVTITVEFSGSRLIVTDYYEAP
ncbi:hypothetical protein SDC9_171197 [bioreactor metagenome]|uniref:Uncharacterized protein n=1 Tax=bioreactor metagenome TaxID=1076179 RepID=A0A645GIT6_9ZZZZ